MSAINHAAAPEFLKLLANDVRWGLLLALATSDLRVQELVAVAGKPINLVSYHLKLLRGEGIVHERRSSADARDIYYSLNLARLEDLYRQSGAQLHLSLAPAAGRETGRNNGQPLRVLFLCTQNRARSQMAEGLLRHLGAGLVEVQSAGLRPGTVHPLAVQTLQERGIDIGAQRSKHVEEVRSQTFDYVITVCDQMREQCPSFGGSAEPSPVSIHWSIKDPIAGAERAGDKETRRKIFAATADELATRIRYFLAAEATGVTADAPSQTA